MSIDNQKFGIPRKYQNQIGIWYFCPKFLGIFLVFYRNFVNVLVKIWLNIGILGQNKIGLVFGFCVCHFIGIGLVSVCHFPENDISSLYRQGGYRRHIQPARSTGRPRATVLASVSAAKLRQRHLPPDHDRSSWAAQTRDRQSFGRGLVWQPLRARSPHCAPVNVKRVLMAQSGY